MSEHFGRPSDFTPEKGDEICARLAAGESLNAITKSDEMPSMPTVYRWMRQNQDFRNNYACAREDQADTLADELVDIADGATGETVNADRLRVDARKWVASKLKPKKYGEKISNEHTGEDGGPIRRVDRIEYVVIDAQDTSSQGLPALPSPEPV